MIAIKTAADSYCVLMIDIDHFKKINDTYGHLVGDKVIRFVADTLKKQVKGKDTVARFGGEEYVILLPETTLSGALSVAENIRSAIEKTRIKRLETDEAISQVMVSIGVARYLPGESTDQLLDRADAALYTSKSKGRNRITIEDGAVIPLKNRPRAKPLAEDLANPG
jgi:diguanylate cyclase